MHKQKWEIMTPEKIQLVHQTFAHLEPHTEMLGSLFYSRLFATAPQLRSLFGEDMRAQERKLIRTLVMVVTGLENFNELIPSLEELGARHRDAYSVLAEYYEPVGNALIWTLKQSLGDLFTASAQEAWVEAYNLIATTMLGDSATTNY